MLDAAGGLTELAWWPDWTGADAAIIASGPGTTKDDVALLRGRLRVIAIKENVDIAPWADVVYGCDAAWWRNKNGLPDFPRLKISATPRTLEKFDIRIVTVKATQDELLLDKKGVIGAGGNSGFQALNLAAQFGAKRVLLLGFDMDDRGGVHWYGRNQGPGRSNPSDVNFRRWRAAFARAEPVLRKAGVTVINGSPVYSVLRCFPRATVAATLEAWGL